MLSVQKLKNIFNKIPVAVLGGGPSLPEDMNKIPNISIRISVNHHAALRYICDFMVFMDNPRKIENKTPKLFSMIKDPGTWPVKVSTWSEYSEIVIDCACWDGGFSSSLATWLACYMGGNPVLLCGMDLYGNRQAYYHDSQSTNTRQHEYPLDNHLNAWRPALTHCPNPERIHAVSGPLTDIFKEYKGE
jgi:hypothetical protein